jgi:hypothetical protein
MSSMEISTRNATRRLAAPAAALLALGALAPASPAASARPGGVRPGGARPGGGPSKSHSTARPPALRNGHELWATIDVCASKPHPMVGVRGSMPSDGQAKETMYMSFQVQYMDQQTKRWVNLPKGGASGAVKVGDASTTRQIGRTFVLAAPGHGGSYELRGIVEFQWRQGSKVTLSTTRPTTGGHPSTAGAVPKGFSAATCTIR